MIYIFHLKPLKDQRERNKSYNISSWTPKATQQLFAFERVSGVCVQRRCHSNVHKLTDWKIKQDLWIATPG